MVLSDIFGADPSSSGGFIKEMDMYALVPTPAPHLLSSQRLGYHHAWPPGVSLQFSPHKDTSTECACVAGGRKHQKLI